MLISHELLPKYRYDQQFVFSDIIVSFIYRGAPGDRSLISGRDICTLDAYYFKIISGDTTKCIPYRRIRRITYRESTIWER